MHLIQLLRPVRTALFCLGVHPMRVRASGTQLRTCRFRQFYSLSVFVMLLPCMYASIRQAVQTIFCRERETNRRLQISNLVQIVQVTLLMVAYVWVLAFGQWSPARKSDFVNVLHRNCAGDRGMLRPVIRRMYGECIVLNVLHLTFVGWLQWLVEDAPVSTMMLVLLVLTVNIEMLYMRALTKLLAARFRAVRLSLNVAFAKPMLFAEAISLQLDQLEHLDRMKFGLQRIYGTFLGVHFILDLMLVILLLFVIWYYSVYVGGSVIYWIAVAAMSSRIVPVGVKIVLLVGPFQELVDEVSGCAKMLGVNRS